MNMMIVGGMVAVGGLIALFVMETKLIGLVMSGVGALFLVMSFYSDQAANHAASVGDMRASEAEFNRDFEEAKLHMRGGDTKTLDPLKKKADELRAQADAVHDQSKTTLATNEEARKPLLDAVTRQIKAASKDEPVDVDSQK